MKFFLFFLFSFFSLSVYAQDIICFKNGEIVEGEICEITSSAIKYKKTSNPSGPIYNIDKSDILSIKFANGEIERFIDTSSPSSSLPSENIFMGSQYSIPKASDNDNEVSKYNNPIFAKKESKNKKADEFTIIYGMGKESIISNDEITISFKFDYTKIGVLAGSPYAIEVKNKTDKTIIFDLSRCFRICSDGSSKSFFDNSMITSVSESQGNTVGASIALPLQNLIPGINWGTNKSNDISTTYNPNKIITIPPNATSKISFNTLAKVNKKNYRIVTVGEGFNGYVLAKKLNLKNNIYNYTEEDTPLDFNYILCYTTFDRPFNYSEIKFNLFVKQIYCGFSPFYYGGWNNAMGSEVSENENKWGYCSDIPKFIKEINKHIEGYNPSFHIIGQGNTY